MTSDIIAKTNGNDRVVDFRDYLVPAQLDNYASMHQEGGLKNDSYPSRIRITLCDFSNGKGVDAQTGKGKSTTVTFNVEPDIPFEWLEVCKQSLGTTTIPMKSAVPKQGGKPWEKELVDNELSVALQNAQMSGKAGNALALLSSGLTQLLGKIVTGKVTAGSTDCFSEIGKTVKGARDAFANQPTSPDVVYLNKGVDYSYVQDKVNVYQKGNDGYAPVSRLTVTRSSYKNGSESTYPWTLKITNGKAVVMEKETGATTFDSKTMKEKTEAYIMVSDRDMFRMMERITSYIRVWENANCIPLVLAGIAQKQKEYEEYRSRNGNY